MAKSADAGLRYEVFEVSLGTDLPAADRTDMWRDHVGGNQGTAETLFGSRNAFVGHTWTQRALGRKENDPDQLQLVEFASSAIVYDRCDAAAKADGDDSARLVIPLDGRIGLRQAGHAVCAGPGELGVLRWDRGMVMSHDDGFRAFILNIPAYALPPAADPRGALGIRPQNAVLRTVRLLAGNLAADRHGLTPVEFVAIGRSLIDLVAGTLDDRQAPQLDGYARLIADACRRIRLYSDDPRLTVQTLADSLGCSRRRLELAMKTVTGRTPGEELRETRLRRAYERLADPDNTQAVVDIATSCGYTSMSWFRAAFVARFDIHPGELRQRARTGVPCAKPSTQNRFR
ncbi:AraC-like DNA-binding protein [Nocardia transvalensis]|uniref:AraC-like DNA-binding protein n=1 Tax=Nocardia transvalensis TaxID=37333 RepID=A0A7W9PMI9_9NOCA|nr:AraC family transcriptional regulator [Nocardia transvalensis]MBB5918831.1 AraC-like DNA-binding protein [Nocardia transvalensis]